MLLTEQGWRYVRADRVNLRVRPGQFVSAAWVVSKIAGLYWCEVGAMRSSASAEGKKKSQKFMGIFESLQSFNNSNILIFIKMTWNS